MAFVPHGEGLVRVVKYQEEVPVRIYLICVCLCSHQSDIRRSKMLGRKERC